MGWIRALISLWNISAIIRFSYLLNSYLHQSHLRHKNLLINELYFQPPNFLDEDGVIVVMTFNACFFSPLHSIRLETALGDFEAVSYDKTNLNIILCRLGFINYIFCNLICSFCKRKHNEKICIVRIKKTISL